MRKWNVLNMLLLFCILTGSDAPKESQKVQSPRAIYKKTFHSIVGIRAYGPLGERKGTGIILDTKGHILTSAAIISSGKSAFDGGIEVFLNGSIKRKGTLVGRIGSHELAMIHIDPAGLTLTPIEMGKSHTLVLGDTAYTIGNASNSIIYSDQPAFSVGIISGIYRLNETRKSSSYKGLVLETSAAVNTGMEGGALLNREGKLIGMITPNYSSKRWMGNAIPIDEIAKDVELLRTRKHPSQMDAILEDPIDENAKGVLGISVELQDGKIMVSDVLAKSPAWKKGIRKGDVIVSVTSQKISTVKEFETLAKTFKEGDVVWLEVDFEGEVDKIQITLAGDSK